MQYRVLNIEEKTKQDGGKYKILSLGQKGTTNRFENVSYWGKDELKKDDLIEGEVVKNDRGYNTFKLPFKSGGGGAGIAKAQERKETGIKQSQDRKEEGIKISSCNRDATLILTSLIGNMNSQDREDWQTKWSEIRKWLIDNYNN